MSESPPRWTPRVPELVAAALVAVALVGSYAPAFSGLVGQWRSDPNFSYGFLVIPFAVVIAWAGRGRLDPSKLRPHWWGFLPLLAVLAARYPLYEWNEQYVETATIPLAALALLFAIGGWHLLRVGGPSASFLFFMLPLPPSWNQWLAGPLQRLATVGSVAMLQVLGLPVLSEGNVIVIGDHPLEVARACNGLSMLLSFVTLVTFFAIVVDRPFVERLVLLAAAIPIALVSNIVRITVTAVCYQWFGAEGESGTGTEWVTWGAHELAGWLMMPLALLMVWGVLALMSWLVVEVDEVEPATLIRRGRPAGPGPGSGAGVP